MRTVIIAGGGATDYLYLGSLLEPDDTVICADSGYDLALKIGVEPDIVVGDFDSAVNKPPEKKTLRFPAKKDFTDTELAISYARERGFSDFLILGGIGTRMDHTLTNILMLKDMLSRGERGEIADEYNRIFITNTSSSIDATKGTLVSLVPLTQCTGITTQGLEYPLYLATLDVGSGRGVSNVITHSNPRVSLQSGDLLITLSRDEPQSCLPGSP